MLSPGVHAAEERVMWKCVNEGMPTVVGAAVGGAPAQKVEKLLQDCFWECSGVSGKDSSRLQTKAVASHQQLSEARALLPALLQLKEGIETRALLISAKNVNVLSSKQSGRLAILQTKGLLEGIADAVRMWLQEEVLTLQSSLHATQGHLAMQQRSGAAGRSRHSQSALYSMELLQAVQRMAKSEDVCRKELANRKFHTIFLRIMSATAAPISVRVECAGGLRGMGDAIPCRATMIKDNCVPMLAKLVDSLNGAPGPEHLNLQLESLMVLSCMLDSGEGRAAVLQHASAALSKVLLTSPSSIGRLTAAAAIALCLGDNSASAYHLVRWTGASTLVVTADVLLSAVEEGQFEHSEAGAMSAIVKAIQNACLNIGLHRDENRCTCDQCGTGEDPLTAENAETISVLSERLNITQRYLATKGSSNYDQDRSTGVWSANEPAENVNPAFGLLLSPSRTQSLPYPAKEPPARKSFFVASKNGSQVVKRSATVSGRRRPNSHQLRRGALPPPWGPPAVPMSEGRDNLSEVGTIDNADAEQEAMRQLVKTSRMELIADSLDFRSWGDRKAWHFLYRHVTKSGGELPGALGYDFEMGGGWEEGQSDRARRERGVRGGTDKREGGGVGRGGTGKREGGWKGREGGGLGREEESENEELEGTQAPESEVEESGQVREDTEEGRRGGSGDGERAPLPQSKPSSPSSRDLLSSATSRHDVSCPLSPHFVGKVSLIGQTQCMCGLCPPGWMNR